MRIVHGKKTQRWPQIKQQINPFDALWLPLYCQISTNRHLFQFPFCQVTKSCDMDKADMSLGIYSDLFQVQYNGTIYPAKATLILNNR